MCQRCYTSALARRKTDIWRSDMRNITRDNRFNGDQQNFPKLKAMGQRV